MIRKTISTTLWIGGILFLLAIWLAASPASGKEYGIPKLNPNQLWVSSIPAGCTVYVVPEHVLRTFQEHELSQEDLKKYLKGSTPCLLTMNPGRYRVAVEKEAAVSKEHGQFTGDRCYLIQEAAAEKSTQFSYDEKGNLTGTETIMKNHRVRKWYLIEKKKDSPFVLLALFQAKDASLDDVASRYPTGNNFTFDEVTLSKKLAEEGVMKSNIEKALKLLHRGGIVALKGKAGAIVVQVTMDNQWELVEKKAAEALGKIKDARTVESLIAALKDKDRRVLSEGVE